MQLNGCRSLVGFSIDPGPTGEFSFRPLNTKHVCEDQSPEEDKCFAEVHEGLVQSSCVRFPFSLGLKA